MTTSQFYGVIKPISLLVILLISLSRVFAQAAPAAPSSDTLVKFNVIVTDPLDRAADDVRQEDLQVTENGAARTLTHFARDERPLTVGFVIDASGSVRRILNYLIDSAKLAAEGMKPGDEGFVARFVGPETFQIKEPMTSDLGSIGDALDDIYVEGGQTAVHDALDKALSYLEEDRSGDAKARRSVLVLVTDGEDRDSKIKDAKAILARARQSDVQIFVLGLTKFSGLQSSGSKAMSLLNGLAEQSGGRAFFPASAAGLPEAAREVARDLHTQFTVGYVASDKAAGLERRVQVKWVGQADPGKRKVIVRPVLAAP
ncbi:MAG TPA: VWA domain-containing protein [Pyrinomonadaceae bacterium]|nr:VWA domain-containing protein [Pyrinomonadaceae bacterium]